MLLISSAQDRRRNGWVLENGKTTLRSEDGGWNFGRTGLEKRASRETKSRATATKGMLTKLL